MSPHRGRGNWALRSFPLLVVLGVAASCGGEAGGTPDGDVFVGTSDAVIDDAGDAGVVASEPWNVLPFARLTAQGTRPDNVLPWPREDREGIFTIRDGHADTAWRPTPGEIVSVQLDLQPWFQRQLPLLSIAMNYDGSEPEDVALRLSDGCHGRAERLVPWPSPSDSLDLDRASAGCVTLQMVVDDDFALQGLELLTDDPERPEPLPQQPAAGTQVPATHPTSGVIEGFYGVPWSWSERWRMVHAISREGLGAYVYAPKHDPLHRAEWRLPYPEDDMDAFAALSEGARVRGVRLFIGISPFIDFETASEADYGVLRDKLLDFVERGVTGVALLADDIELEGASEPDGAMGAAQVVVANRLLADLRERDADLQLWFCPTAYSDARTDGWSQGPEYLAELAALHADIEVLWTGPDTFSAEMVPNDLTRVTAATGRAPLIWDNMWANDGGDLFMARLLLGPFSGRPASLADAVVGIAHNPSIQGSLSRLTLGTFAHYWNDPARYEPERAAAASSAKEMTFGRDGEEGVRATRDADLLAFVMALFDAHSDTEVPSHLAFENALERLDEGLSGASPPAAGELAEAVGALLPFVGRMIVLPSALHHSGADPELVDELVYPVARVHHEARRVAALLDALGRLLSDLDAADELASARACAEEANRVRFSFGHGGVQRLANTVAALEPFAAGFLAPSRSADDVPGCRAGEHWLWRPFDTDARLAVYGLPGAVIQDGVVSWVPEHAGRWSVFVTAVDDRGWASISSDIVCEQN